MPQRETVLSNDKRAPQATPRIANPSSLPSERRSDDEAGTSGVRNGILSRTVGEAWAWG